MKKNSGIFWLIFVLLVGCAKSSYAENLIFAGFTFSGEAAGIPARYPFLSELYKQKTPKGMSSLSSQVMARLGQVNNSNLTIAPPDAMMNLKNMDGGLVTILLVTGETVLNENYGSYYKTFINLSADALIFDYKNKTIVRSYPLNLVLFDASPGSQSPSKQKIQELILDMITRQDDKGLISQYLSRLSKATLPKDGVKSIQVAKVDVNPDAYGMFPAQLRGNQNAVKDILSDGFSSALSAKTGVAILPSKIGQALGMMTLKLENSDGQIKIKIGDGDYLVNLKLNKYAKIKKDETAVEVSNIYATSINIDIYEQLSDQHFLQSDFKNGELSITPINKQAGDDFPGYMDSLNGIFKKFADAIKTDDLGWAKAAASSSNISSEISKTRKMIESNM
jgi:hypothetical protein